MPLRHASRAGWLLLAAVFFSAAACAAATSLPAPQRLLDDLDRAAAGLVLPGQGTGRLTQPAPVSDEQLAAQASAGEPAFDAGYYAPPDEEGSPSETSQQALERLVEARDYQDDAVSLDAVAAARSGAHVLVLPLQHIAMHPATPLARVIADDMQQAVQEAEEAVARVMAAALAGEQAEASAGVRLRGSEVHTQPAPDGSSDIEIRLTLEADQLDRAAQVQALGGRRAGPAEPTAARRSPMLTAVTLRQPDRIEAVVESSADAQQTQALLEQLLAEQLEAQAPKLHGSMQQRRAVAAAAAAAATAAASSALGGKPWKTLELSLEVAGGAARSGGGIPFIIAAMVVAQLCLCFVVALLYVQALWGGAEPGDAEAKRCGGGEPDGSSSLGQQFITYVSLAEDGVAAVKKVPAF